MFREPHAQPETKLPPCALCGEPSTGAVWDVRLCDGCRARWQAESKPLAQLELAHADAHPVDVEARGELQFIAVGQERRWALLRPGVSPRLARAETQRWLTDAKTKARAA